MNYVNSFDLFGVPAKQIPATPGSGAPTTATEGAVGCLYMDTDTGNLYKCTAVADGVYTWVEAGNGGGNQTAGLSDTAASLLITILRNGIYGPDQSVNITALEAELAGYGESGGDEPVIPDEPDEPEVTLSSISATYSGGDVAVGTAVTDLTGIVVTATYSDGSTASVTDYTLSGEIVEGSNTIAVSYGGKTTTFTVTGVAESGGEPVEVAKTMPEDNCANSWVNSNCYSDNGSTAFAGTKGSAQGNIWVSDVFEQDTVVTVTVLYGITNANLRQYCGCLSADTVLGAGSNDGVSVYYLEQIGTANTTEYTAQYTVRAGYRLAFINYNAGKPQSFVVTK